MTGSYRASVGHHPKILVKRANPVVLAGQEIGFTVGASTTWPLKAGMLVGTWPYDAPISADITDRATLDWHVIASSEAMTVAQAQNYVNLVKAINPDAVILQYINSSEIRPNNTDLTTQWNTMNWWARSAYPSGTIQTIQNPASNEASPRLSGGLTPMQYITNRSLNTDNFKSVVGLDGNFRDNVRITSINSYDYDEDGASNDKRSVAMRNALRDAHVQHNAWYRLQFPGKFIGCNGAHAVMAELWRSPDFNDDSAAYNTSNFEYGFHEGYLGKWNSPEGVFFYFNNSNMRPPGSWTGYRTWPEGVALTTAPPEGTMVSNGFGRWDEPVVGNGSIPYLYAIRTSHNKLLHYFDRSRLMIGTYLPGNARLNQWAGVKQAYRYAVAAVYAMTDCSLGCSNMETGYSGVVRIDETEFSWGSPIDQPGVVAGVWQQGAYMRRFDMGNGNQLICICNPRDNGQKTLTLPAPPNGKAWYALQASLYFNQDPAVNNGAKNVTNTVTLADRDGRVLITGPA